MHVCLKRQKIKQMNVLLLRFVSWAAELEYANVVEKLASPFPIDSSELII